MANIGNSAEYPVHIGYWTNWSYGRITGATVTLNSRQGTFLTAFLAVFVTFVGNRLWKIMCFGLHQYLSSEKAEDAIYHQRQMILRNSTDEISSLGNLLSVLSAWRQKADNPFYRMLPLIGLSIICASAFTVASIFSSKISSAMGNEILISSPSCGISSEDTQDPQKLQTIFSPWVSQQMSSSANYAQKCYSNASVDGCGPFIKRRLPSTVDRNASCPFEGLCRRKDSNIRLDTGLFDSHKDLGLNAPETLRFTMRIVNHCAPLVSEGHKQAFNYSNDLSYVRYFYGPRKNVGNVNHTYQYQKRTNTRMIFDDLALFDQDYNIGLLRAHSFNGSLNVADQWTDFFPVDGLFQGDGDLMLGFLSANNIYYIQEVNDPLYAAHEVSERPERLVPVYENVTGYYADEPASAIACKMQYQTCDLSAKTCSPLGSVDDLPTGINSERSETASWIWGGKFDDTTELLDVLEALGSSSLTSKDSLLGGSQGPLSDNQWQRDVEYWHNTLLAFYQIGTLYSAIGPGDSGMLENFWKRPGTRDQKYFCKNQKIISTAFTNFSVLWLTIVSILGCLIILVSYTMESAIVYIDKRHKKTKYSHLEWFANDQFQLQRMAHEQLGMGTWTGCAGVRAIPVTMEKGQALAMLDCTDSEHPVLKTEGGVTVNGNNVLAGKTNNDPVINTNSWTPTSHISTTVNSDPQKDVTTTDVENTAVATLAPCPVSANSIYQSGDVAAAAPAQHGNEAADSGSGATSGVEDTPSTSESTFLPGSSVTNRPTGDNASSSQA